MYSPDRATILDTAVRLFYTQGFHHVDVIDIGRALGAAGNSISHYFPSRESLKIAALAWRDQCLREELDNYVVTHANTPSERLLVTARIGVTLVRQTHTNCNLIPLQPSKTHPQTITVVALSGMES